MQPTPEEAERLKEILSRYWEKAKCEVCGTCDWKTTGEIFQLREFRAPIEQVAVVPVLAIHCQTCGNTKLASAISLGLVDPKSGERING